MTNSRRLLALMTPALVGAALWVATASAAPIAFSPCATRTSIDCGTLVVPLDRADPGKGTLSLHVERRRARGTPRGTMVLLAGGPGQAGTPISPDDPVAGAIPSWDYVMLDQRGTGQGALRCDALDSRSSTGSSAEDAQCAEQVGPRRVFYTTRDSVLDLEDLRDGLGVGGMALGGVSYGTYVAQYYAQTYPSRITHLVLDSTIDPAGWTGYEADSFRAVPRVLRDLCARRRCARITPDPVGDIAELVAATATRPIRGNRTTFAGRVVRDSIGGPGSQGDMPSLLVTGDMSSSVRALWPGAARAARRGDAAPLMRLATMASAGGYTPPTVISNALYMSTLCADTALPWTSATAVADRAALARAGAEALGAATFAPFGIDNVLDGSTVATCNPWPDAGLDPLVAGPLPPVPTLIMSGGQDLRTPLESAQAVQARAPGSTLLLAPGNGHSLLYSLSCARAQMAKLLAGQRTSASACNREAPPITPIAVPPATVSAISPSGAPGTAGRVAHAARLTIQDGVQSMNAAIDSGLSALPGIRGGLARAGDIFLASIRFSRFSAVRGVRITGSLRFNGSTFEGPISVDGPGAYDGRLHLARGGERAYTGFIGGVPVRIPLG